MKKQVLVIFLLVALLFAGGCIKSKSADAVVRAIPQVKQFLEKNPDAKVTVVKKTDADITADMNRIALLCKKEIPAGAYYYGTMVAKLETMHVWIGQKAKEPECIAIVVAPVDGCKTAKDCDDNDSATRDDCKGKPRVCINTLIKGRCVDGDGKCRPDCDKHGDTDCAPAEQISPENPDPDIPDPQDNPSTPTCADQSGVSCKTSERCNGSVLQASDSQTCCQGVCELATCSELSGKACHLGYVCSGPLVAASDNQTCCLAQCVNPLLGECLTDGDCGEASDSTKKNVCTGTPKKCLVRTKTCDEFGGVKCNPSEGCESGFIYASDSAKCCLSGCTAADACTNVTCPENRRCDLGECVLKTCSEQGGAICIQTDDGIHARVWEKCTVNYILSLNSSVCCPSSGQCVEDCNSMDGNICTENDVCDSEFKQSSDSQYCCTGTCSLKCDLRACSDGDDCCPTGCTYDSDHDCPDPSCLSRPCTDNDSCCPTGCTQGNDNDCP